MGKEFGLGIVVALVLTCLNMRFERTEYSRYIETPSFDWLQRKLSTEEAFSRIVVLDIGDLPAAQNHEGKLFTSRTSLQHLIENVVEQHPLAIGIDIDFSPEADGRYVYYGDPEFFRRCLNLKPFTRVVLGIDRSRSLTPDRWLGNKDYASLAASILVPHDPDGAIKMAEWIRVADRPTPLPTISAALADSLREPVSGVNTWKNLFIQATAVRHLSHVSASEFLIDYSGLHSIRKIRAFPENAALLSGLENKIVLIGYVTGALDTFSIPFHEDPIPGVMVHACATATLIRPLYQWTVISRLVIDFLLFSLGFAIVSSILHRSEVAGWTLVDKTFVQTLVAYSIATTVIVASSTVLITAFRIFWDDFLLVIFALLLHRRVEHCFRKAIHYCAKSYSFLNRTIVQK